MKIKFLLVVIFVLLYENFVFGFEWWYFKTSKLKPKGIITSSAKLTIRRYEKALSKINTNTNLCQQKISSNRNFNFSFWYLLEKNAQRNRFI